MQKTKKLRDKPMVYLISQRSLEQWRLPLYFPLGCPLSQSGAILVLPEGGDAP